jgi:hypothetical protein
MLIKVEHSLSPYPCQIGKKETKVVEHFLSFVFDRKLLEDFHYAN